MKHPLCSENMNELQELANASGEHFLVTRKEEAGAHFNPGKLINPASHLDELRFHLVVGIPGTVHAFHSEHELMTFARAHFGQSMAPSETE